MNTYYLVMILTHTDLIPYAYMYLEPIRKEDIIQHACSAFNNIQFEEEPCKELQSHLHEFIAYDAGLFEYTLEQVPEFISQLFYFERKMSDNFTPYSFGPPLPQSLCANVD